MLHRLVRGTIFTQPDGIVREYVDHTLPHQTGQTHGRPHVIGEYKKRAAVGSQSADRQTVARGCHRVLADAKVKIAASILPCLEMPGNLGIDQRQVGGRQVGRTADQPGNMRGQPIQHFAGTDPRGLAFRIRFELRNPLLPPRRQLACPDRLQFRSQLRILPCVLVPLPRPGLLQFTSTLADARCKVRDHFRRDPELLILGPTQGRFRQTHFLFAQRRAVCAR